ncbi:MAG: tyrosine recombinase XerC [Betaproteobacteria bacterium]|nr:MAG: tyrosine recombinase XerC [Betaproteobacteria bacterium]
MGNFLAHIEQERRLSAHTIKSYRRDIELLLQICTATPLEDLRMHHIRRCVARLHAEGRSGRSLARALSAWRSFFSFLMRDHGFTQNPCVGVRAPRTARRLPDVLSPEEVTTLVELPAEDAFAVRDRAMFELLYSSGLRLSELTALKAADIDFDDATVRVVGKGGKTRVVPVGRFALRSVQDWLAKRETIAKGQSTALFLNHRGKAIGPRTVQRRLTVWSRKRGLAQNVHPHMLRHSFASHVLQSSGDLRAVQEMLGHASISTTQVYTHLDWQHLANVYDAAHPRAKRKSAKSSR